MSTAIPAMSIPPATLTSSQGDNRLVGWLISYALDEMGASFELRAGRSFITSEKKGDRHTISIQENSISQPHAALNALGQEKILFFQDVFSERGSFITRAGSPKEEQICGPIELKHGDWIRIGEATKFQVCLLKSA